MSRCLMGELWILFLCCALLKSQGYDKNVVVLTRNRGYRKKGKDMKIPHFIYKKYPRLRVVLSKRCRIYNEQLDLVEQLEDKGRIVVISS